VERPQRSAAAVDSPILGVDPIKRKVVAVSGGDGRYDRLLATLSQIYPVDFRPMGAHASERADGVVVLDGNVSLGRRAAESGAAAFVVVEDGGDPVRVPNAEARLGTSPILDQRLRGQILGCDEVAAFHPLQVLPGDVELGTKGGHPFWLERPAARGSCQLVALAPPVVGEREYVVEHFHGLRHLRLLPLMNFLRQITAAVDWQVPAQHACIVLDDPSLYWRTYGFVNFRLLADHAKRHGYSVSVATIPLDAWWVHPSVAETFRSEFPRLSLIIHGNNHTKQEMLRPQDAKRGLEAAAQALRRFDRLRTKHGLPVAKVMEPPHGAVTSDLFPHLLALGYEAALATFESLVRMNRPFAWPAKLGLEPAALLAGGLPVLPRVQAGPAWKTDVKLAAFLRQPVAVTVHHQDAAQRMEALAEIAECVNSIGDVTWSGIPSIVRCNYRERREGDVLHVQMWSRAVTVNVPADVRKICIHRPWLTEGQSEKVIVRPTEGSVFEADVGAVSQRFAVRATVVNVSSQLAGPIHYSSVPQPGLPLWPIARKVMMEVRDRLTPALSLVGIGGRSTRSPQQ
jgi:hypothetical protein